VVLGVCLLGVGGKAVVGGFGDIAQSEERLGDLVTRVRAALSKRGATLDIECGLEPVGLVWGNVEGGRADAAVPTANRFPLPSTHLLPVAVVVLDSEIIIIISRALVRERFVGNPRLTTRRLTSVSIDYAYVTTLMCLLTFLVFWVFLFVLL
jgi:hypothetical protein